MGKRLFIESIDKLDLLPNVSIGGDEDFFDIEKIRLFESDKRSELGNAFGLFRKKHNMEPGPDPYYYEFTIHLTLEKLKEVLEYAKMDFYQDYINQEGWYDIDKKDHILMESEIAEIEKIISDFDESKNALIIGYL